MKQLLLFLLCASFGFTAYCQEEPTFSQEERAKIRTILKGTKTAAVFDSKGAMRIDRTRKLRRVRVISGGGFQLPNAGNAAWALIKSHWVLVADDVAQVGALRTKLGAEKFQQLHEILSSKESH